jgi:DNA-binding NarL/FixJ family response regulator
MEHLSPTAVFTVPGDVSDQYYTRLYDSVLSGAGGIFHLTTVDGGVRELALRKVRQGPTEWSSLRMVLRPGIGLVGMNAGAVAPGADSSQPREPGRRIVVVDPADTLTPELAAALQQTYPVDVLRSVEGLRPPHDTGALLLTLDPQEPERTLDEVRYLRQNGVTQAIVLAVTGEGFRTATRARAIRAGADEVLEYDRPPKELLDRVEAARQRGHQRVANSRHDLLLLQPTDEMGEPLPVDEVELARAVDRHVRESEHPFFALVLVKPAQGAHAQAWNALAGELRLADGDLLAECGDGRLALYLHDISRKRVLDLMSRIRSRHPDLRLSEETIYAYPFDRSAILEWVAHAGLQEARATA